MTAKRERKAFYVTVRKSSTIRATVRAFDVSDVMTMNQSELEDLLFTDPSYNGDEVYDLEVTEAREVTT